MATPDLIVKYVQNGHASNTRRPRAGLLSNQHETHHAGLDRTVAGKNIMDVTILTLFCSTTLDSVANATAVSPHYDHQNHRRHHRDGSAKHSPFRHIKPLSGAHFATSSLTLLILLSRQKNRAASRTVSSGWVFHGSRT